MMLYEHGDLIFKAGHRRFHPVHMSAYRFHITPQLFKRKLYGVHGLAVRDRLNPALKLIHAVAEFAHPRRCAPLRFLAEDADYAMNTSLLQSALDAVGHGVSRDCVNGDAAWLEEQGLVFCEDLGGLIVVKITQRGLDVAEGRAVVPGVKRPGPGF